MQSRVSGATFMKKQEFVPKFPNIKPDHSIAISTLGLNQPDELASRRGRDWQRHQVVRQDCFLLNVLEAFQSAGSVGYTRQEDYIKINFWLGGRHSTILDGFGQHDHDCPEVFITAGPLDMLKIDLCGRNTHVASVALCVQPSFFPMHLGLGADQVPDPFRALLRGEIDGYVFHRLPLSPDLAGATRAILAAPSAVRKEPMYVQAKAVELMCLLLNRLESAARRPSSGERIRRREAQLHAARDFMTHRYGEDLTLERICREVGLNRMALTSGFRDVFAMSVHDWLQKVRMERAYELLRDEAHTVYQIAEAVGYRHSCNFSTAFHSYFGCTPQGVRAGRHN